jgi:hypothetical protein
VKVENAIIQSAEIMFSRGFILDCWLFVDRASGTQGFGGWVLGGNPFSEAKCAEHGGPNFAADFIGGMMAIAGVEKFSELKGRAIRIELDEKTGTIRGVGHVVKDIWYRPEPRFQVLTAEASQAPVMEIGGLC